jgi:hypothetical protein
LLLDRLVSLRSARWIRSFTSELLSCEGFTPVGVLLEPVPVADDVDGEDADVEVLSALEDDVLGGGVLVSVLDGVLLVAGAVVVVVVVVVVEVVCGVVLVVLDDAGAAVDGGVLPVALIAPEAPVSELTAPLAEGVLEAVLGGALAVPAAPPVVGVVAELLLFTRVALAFWSVLAAWKYLATSARNVRVLAGAGTLPVSSCLNGITRP